jgi:cold shock CspA family protein
MEGMEREQGTLIHWDDDKGYGFLRSNDGKQETFLHIKALSLYQRRPRIGDVLTYAVQMDEKERPTALIWSR